MKFIGLLAAVFSLSLAGAARGAGELNLFAWSEYVPQEVIDGFTRESGVKVNYETYASNEEMVSKLLAGALPLLLVATSVSCWPKATAWLRVTLNWPLPVPSVCNGALPKKVAPSPKPLASQDGLAKMSMR